MDGRHEHADGLATALDQHARPLPARAEADRQRAVQRPCLDARPRPVLGSLSNEHESPVGEDQGAADLAQHPGPQTRRDRQPQPLGQHDGPVVLLLDQRLHLRRQQRAIVDVLDFLAPLPGIGIFAVRCANFINGELWGKPTQAAWGFIVDPSKLFPTQRAEAERMCDRFSIDPCVLHVHASQLYEGVLEGLVLFVILWIYTSKPRPRLAPGGLFLLCYGLFRFMVEFVRVPDENRGYLLLNWVTMGQILSTPMILAGLTMLFIAYRRNEPTGNLVRQ